MRLHLLLVLASVPLAIGGCDASNRPTGHPHAEPRRSCFSEVDCPSDQRCLKGPQDIEGRCLPPTAMDDGGSSPPAPAPAPTITASPSDIEI